MTALVIGGGVAGLTAVVWLTRYDAPFRWISADGAVGGMLDTVYNPIIDYPGIHAPNGPQAVESLRHWASNLEPPKQDRVELVRAVDDGFEVTSPLGSASYRTVLIATGTRRRLLGIPGEQEGLGHCVLTSTAKEPERFRGKRVMLVGGGDAAIEGALNAVDAGASEVIVVSRSEPSAQRQFVTRFQDEPRASRFPTLCSPARFENHEDGCRVSLDNGESLDVDLVVVRVGVEVVRPRLDPRPRLDERGFIVVDGRCETDVPGLFAAGDVTSTPLRSIATSVGDGTRAGRSMAELLGIWT